MTNAAPTQIPPIVRQAQRVRAEIEISVRRMARLDKYSVGAELRDQARQCVRLAQKAWRQPTQQRQHVRALVEAVDELKLALQLGMDVSAFRSMEEFEALGRAVVDLGRQSGGWLKSLQTMGQSAPARTAPAQRAPILSSRAAHEATP